MITRDELERAMGGGHVYLHPEELEPLARYASTAHLLIEIGTAYGGGACLLLMNAPAPAKVHSIDPFLPDTQGGWVARPDKTRQYVSNAAKALGFDASRWILHEITSAVAAQDCPPRVDFLFLDGDHRYEAVKRDFEDWIKLVKPDGVILIHDSRRVPGTPEKEFNQGWPGPTQLAEELRRDSRVTLLEEIHSLTVWRKV